MAFRLALGWNLIFIGCTATTPFGALMLPIGLVVSALALADVSRWVQHLRKDY